MTLTESGREAIAVLTARKKSACLQVVKINSFTAKIMDMDKKRAIFVKLNQTIRYFYINRLKTQFQL